MFLVSAPVVTAGRRYPNSHCLSLNSFAKKKHVAPAKQIGPLSPNVFPVFELETQTIGLVELSCVPIKPLNVPIAFP